MQSFPPVGSLFLVMYCDYGSVCAALLFLCQVSSSFANLQGNDCILCAELSSKALLLYKLSGPLKSELFTSRHGDM